MRISGLSTGLFALVLWAGGALADEAGGVGAHRLLGDYDVDDGSYTLVGLTWGHQNHRIQGELGDFYVDDPALLAELKSQWVTGEPAPLYACGYHYTILLVRDRRTVDSFSINLETECGTVVTDAGSYRFDTALLTRHADRYRKPVVEWREFASLAAGRDYLAGLAGNRRLLLTPDPQWREYDGEVRFYAPCPGHDFTEATIGACIDRARAEIETKYPGETFDLSSAGSAGENITIEMKSSKSLYAGFDLYEIAYGWQDYQPALILYWKQAE